jgi:hypothetical protein
VRYGYLCLAAFPLAVLGCGSSSEAVESSAGQALSQGDASDTSCQVVLRDTDINFESSLGPQTDCSSGTCWVVIPVVFDVAMSESLDGAEGYVLFQGAAGGAWQQSAQAEPTFGAPIGFRRYQVTLAQNTFEASDANAVVSLIPYIQTVQGQSLFDHNRVPNVLGSYTLNQANNWTIGEDSSACPGAAPSGVLTATFATGWQNASTGTLVPAGKLDVAYDIYRMPSALGCSTDGVNAFATTGFVEFQPSGTTQSELLSGPLDATTSRFDSLPLEFDVPPGTTSAALWFLASSDCTGDQWDSNYGQNYPFAVP